jgi:hypothetical protein
VKRRGVLAALTGGLASIAGCNGFGVRRRQFNYDVPETVAGDAADRVTNDPDIEGGTRVVESGLGPRPRTFVVGGRPFLTRGPGVGVPEGATATFAFVSSPDADSPARLRAAVTNVTDRPQAFELSGAPLGDPRGYPADPSAPDVDGPTAYLLPVDETPSTLVETDAGRIWQARDEVDGPSTRTPSVATTVALGAGESVVGDYSLVLAPGVTDWDGPTEYRFGFRDVGRRPGAAVPVTVSTWTAADAAPGESRFEGIVPSVAGVGRTVWYHRARANQPIYLEPPEGERIDLPGRGTFTLRNFSTVTAGVGLDDWTVSKYDGTTWRQIPRAPGRRLVDPVPPGTDVELTVSVAGVDGDPPPGGGGRTVGLDGLGGGRYAVQFGTTAVPLDVTDPVRVRTGVSDPPEAKLRVGYAALVDLRGPSVELGPPPGLRRVGRDGDRLTVALGDEPENALEVRRLDPPTRPTVPFITEQLLRVSDVRAGVSLLRSVPELRSVRVVSDPAIGPVSPGGSLLERFGGDDRKVRFSYEDRPYRAGSPDADPTTPG